MPDSADSFDKQLLQDQLQIITTPIDELFNPLFEDRQLRVFIKREDLCHPVISGNKWHKLVLNLVAAKRDGFKKILSFGGAWSNHIHALAYVCKQLDLESIAIIRGDELVNRQLNSCLQDAIEWGMSLHFVSRQAYQLKDTQAFQKGLTEQFGDFYLIPEGGANSLAVVSTASFASACMGQFQRLWQHPPDYVLMSCGTGCTLAGFVAGLQQSNVKPMLHGYLAVQDENNIRQRIEAFLKAIDLPMCNADFQLSAAYVMGGYGKKSALLADFMQDFYQQHHIQLDPVYTAKLFYGFYQDLQKGLYPAGSSVLLLHSGGLQGSRSL